MTCRYFANGNCKDGANCRYLHAENRPTNSNQPTNNNNNSNQPRTEQSSIPRDQYLHLQGKYESLKLKANPRKGIIQFHANFISNYNADQVPTYLPNHYVLPTMLCLRMSAMVFVCFVLFVFCLLCTAFAHF
jgi:hypothetical protein